MENSRAGSSDPTPCGSKKQFRSQSKSPQRPRSRLVLGGFNPSQKYAKIIENQWEPSGQIWLKTSGTTDEIGDSLQFSATIIHDPSNPFQEIYQPHQPLLESPAPLSKRPTATPIGHDHLLATSHASSGAAAGDGSIEMVPRIWWWWKDGNHPKRNSEIHSFWPIPPFWRAMNFDPCSHVWIV